MKTLIISFFTPKRLPSNFTKRKCEKYTYATEKFSDQVQKEKGLSKGTREFAKAISEGCYKLRMKMKN